jgi:hypothetical protein
MTPDPRPGKRGAQIAADHVKGFHIIAGHSLELVAGVERRHPLTTLLHPGLEPGSKNLASATLGAGRIHGYRLALRLAGTRDWWNWRRSAQSVSDTRP